MKLPRWYELALAERGVKEAPGKANNAVVQAYYRDSGHPEVVAVGLWAVGDMSLAELVAALPIMLGGLGLAALGAKVDDAKRAQSGGAKPPKPV